MCFYKHKIKALRESLKMTQKQFAWQLEVDQVTVCRWETGVCFPTVRHIVALSKLAKRFGKTINLFEEG